MTLTGRAIRLFATLGAVVALAACADEAGRSAFTETGEVIALGGGDGGPRFACFSCHGLRGEGDGRATPRLAGLPAGYLQRQLQDYGDGRRDDPVMSPIARTLDADDRRLAADYYAGLPVVPQSAPSQPAQGAGALLYHRGDPSRGLAPCASCHGHSGEGLGPANPPLAGQPASYTVEQLRRWREGRRQNDPLGIMRTISQAMTADEAEAIARYVQGLAPPAAPAAAPPEASP